MTDIFHWTCSAPPKQASFLNLKGVDSQWAIDISEGRKLPGPFPKEAYFEMNPERKTENKLGDQHYNREGLVVIGPRLTEFVRSLGEKDVELLPVKIHDHQGKVIPTEYHIVHTARQIDCIDAKASGVKWNPIDPDSMLTWKTLKLKSGDHKFPKIFRIKHICNKIFVREDVMQTIEDMDLKKPYFEALDEVD